MERHELFDEVARAALEQAKKTLGEKSMSAILEVKELVAIAAMASREAGN